MNGCSPAKQLLDSIHRPPACGLHARELRSPPPALPPPPPSQEMQLWSNKTASNLESKMHQTLNAAMPVLTKAVVEQLSKAAKK